MDLHHIREEYRKRVLSQQNCQIIRFRNLNCG